MKVFEEGSGSGMMKVKGEIGKLKRVIILSENWRTTLPSKQHLLTEYTAWCSASWQSLEEIAASVSDSQIFFITPLKRKSGQIQ